MHCKVETHSRYLQMFSSFKKQTSTPRGPIRLREIKLSIKLENSSGTSSCKIQYKLNFVFQLKAVIANHHKKSGYGPV